MASICHFVTVLFLIQRTSSSGMSRGFPPVTAVFGHTQATLQKASKKNLRLRLPLSQSRK
ncbi:hypothetical protein ANCCAN_07101 [Ancylostoma caninum]|uniref:Uncharacterized protein n=1 Tax=Ancylostoma caninum TaxID=29170 RepID=A0A368GRC4_ANCCA|nr:hypothetical protein ANCCAN_07101 [Ancylostoma caninum]